VRNLAPKSRAERHGTVHKEDLEKMRLSQRRECFYHYEPNSLTPPPDSLSHIAESDRFETNAAAAEKASRNAVLMRKEQVLHAKRIARTHTEEERWRVVEAEHEAELARHEAMAREGTFCKSNKTSMPYDPITLQYGEGKDGQCLRYSDESLRYRAAMRAANLQQRTNVAGFNPITGEETARVPVPEKPVLPEYLQGIIPGH